MKTVAGKVHAIAPVVTDWCSPDVPPQASSHPSPWTQSQPRPSAAHPSCSLGRDTPVTAAPHPAQQGPGVPSSEGRSRAAGHLRGSSNRIPNKPGFPLLESFPLTHLASPTSSFSSQALLESLAGTVGCQSNLLEGQKETINQFQNTHTQKCLFTPVKQFLNRGKRPQLLCALGSAGAAFTHFFSITWAWKLPLCSLLSSYRNKLQLLHSQRWAVVEGKIQPTVWLGTFLELGPLWGSSPHALALLHNCI